jgi:GGDEF domain-containing protein
MLSRDHLEARAEASRHPALTDPLTGLASRLHFELVYGYLFAAGPVSRRPSTSGSAAKL